MDAGATLGGGKVLLPRAVARPQPFRDYNLLGEGVSSMHLLLRQLG